LRSRTDPTLYPSAGDGVSLVGQDGSVHVRRRSSWAGVALATILVAGCGGGAEPGASFDDDGEPAGTEADEAVEEAAEASTMPDVVGLPVDEATAALEEAGFRVSTGVVRTTEMEPDLVYRSEPAPGRRVQEGQRVTLRIAAEPRQ
jgi:hypothetical protein